MNVSCDNNLILEITVLNGISKNLFKLAFQKTFFCCDLFVKVNM